jgi:hypothetical protein
MNMIFSQRMNEMSFRVSKQPLHVATTGPGKFFRLTRRTHRDLLGGGSNHSRALLLTQTGSFEILIPVRRYS